MFCAVRISLSEVMCFSTVHNDMKIEDDILMLVTVNFTYFLFEDNNVLLRYSMVSEFKRTQRG